MQIRVVKSIYCPRCTTYLELLKLKRIPHVIYDADNKDNQKQLDAWFIVAMPVVQLIDGDTVVHQFPPGPISTKVILRKFAEFATQRGQPTIPSV